MVVAAKHLEPARPDLLHSAVHRLNFVCIVLTWGRFKVWIVRFPCAFFLVPRCLTSIVFHSVKLFLLHHQLSLSYIDVLLTEGVFVELWSVTAILHNRTLHHQVKVFRTLLELRQLLRHISVLISSAGGRDSSYVVFTEIIKFTLVRNLVFRARSVPSRFQGIIEQSSSRSCP